MTVVASAKHALEGIADGATILVGGFGDMGVPYNLLEALAESGVTDLTVVSCNGGDKEVGIPRLVAQGQVRKLITAAAGPGSHHVRQSHEEGRIEVELVSQGVLAERIRAAAAGMTAFFTRIGADTELAAGKETAEFGGELHVLEYAIRGDVALVKADTADMRGNLVYRGGWRNYNAVMATAARTTIAEVDTLVPAGGIDPECVVTPAPFVDRIVHVAGRSQGLFTVCDEEQRARWTARPARGLSRWELAEVVGADLPSGAVVNLGTGMPGLIAGAAPRSDVIYHAEQGIVGILGFAVADAREDLQTAGRQAVGLAPGASFVASDTSFQLASCGRLAVAVLGAMEVSAGGDLASWRRPGWRLGIVGGAIELAQGAKEVWVMMSHTDREGHPKLRNVCSLALTGTRCVRRVYTELAVFEIDERVRLRALAPGLTVDDVRASTGVEFEASAPVTVMGRTLTNVDDWAEA